MLFKKYKTMKKIAMLLLITFFYSCHKEKGDASSTGIASIEYTINGDQVKITNTSLTTLPISSVIGIRYHLPNSQSGYQFAGTYTVTAQNEQNKSVLIILEIDSASVGKQYTSASSPISINILENNIRYSAGFNDSTSFSTEITNYANGLISGTFSATIQTLGQNNNYIFSNVTDGKFTNIKLTY